MARRKVDLNWMTTPARAAAIDAAIGSSSMGRFAANGNAAGDSSAIRSRPVVRFWEGCEEGGYTSTHLSSAPMSLGWYDGYTQEVLSANLARPGLSEFWRSWDNCTALACDRNLFEDIKEKISFGLLYCECRHEISRSHPPSRFADTPARGGGRGLLPARLCASGHLRPGPHSAVAADEDVSDHGAARAAWDDQWR